jgi:hypothetical protein
MILTCADCFDQFTSQIDLSASGAALPTESACGAGFRVSKPNQELHPRS